MTALKKMKSEVNMNWMLAAESAYQNGKENAFAQIKEIIKLCLDEIASSHDDFSAGSRFAFKLLETKIQNLQQK